jgi:hypothetical protein
LSRSTRHVHRREPVTPVTAPAERADPARSGPLAGAAVTLEIVDRIAGWWDGFELWVAGLPFLPQFAVVLAGMVPVSLALAYLLDRVLRVVLRVLGRDRVTGPDRSRQPDRTQPPQRTQRPAVSGSVAPPARQKETV